jgi:hypothetical protein
MSFALRKLASSNPSRWVLLLLFVPTVIGRLEGAEKPDFTGSYTLTGTKGSVKVEKGSSWMLKAIQGDTEIEITKIIDGKPDNYKARLDGTEAVYTSPGGVKGTCTARLKGKALMLQTLVSSRPQSGGPLVQIRTRERWTLSPDGKTLTIRNEVDSPTLALPGFQLEEPWTELYTRQ